MFSFTQFGNDLYSGRRSYEFVGRWKLFVGIGAGLCVLSIALLAIFGLNPGIEFRGGSEFRVTGTANADPAVGESVVSKAFPESEPPRGTVIGSDSIRIQTERLNDQQTDAVKHDLATAYHVDASAVTSSFVGPSWGQDITNKALSGLGIFLLLVGIMIALYFRAWQMAAAALIALMHDLLITVGLYSATGFEVTPGTAIGLLTILGYSLYDTIVVFDKVRENTAHILSSTKRTYAEAANLAVNQTLVRSINTSVVALLPVASILFIGAFLLGAGTLRDISLALFIGMIVGTFSSVFIATPLFVRFRMGDPKIRAQAERVHRARAASGKAASQPGHPAVQAATAGSAAEPAASVGGATALLTAEDDGGPDGDSGAARASAAGGQRVQPRRNRPRPKKR
ncbi:MAG: protein translocase subunit SecF [Actinomycetes bacterium]